MKVYALAVLLLFCIVENTTAANWQSDVKISHWQHINSIVNDTIGRIRSDANKTGTPAAQQCAEQARQELKNISDRGYSDVSSCVRSASTQGIANLCAQQVDSRVFDEALGVSRTADTCINNA